jgi:hypothetical protein
VTQTPNLATNGREVSHEELPILGHQDCGVPSRGEPPDARPFVLFSLVKLSLLVEHEGRFGHQRATMRDQGRGIGFFGGAN